MLSKTPSSLNDSWTDDLERCPLAGIGIVTNVIYRHNGQQIQEHSMENTCIRFKGDGDTCLYGVFDGHDGNTMAEYAAQKLAAELLLGQLNEKLTDDDVKDVLREAFASVERDFFALMGDVLARRTQILMQLPENIYEAQRDYPRLVDELNDIQQRIPQSGASAALALVYRGKLYAANVGDCRVLHCRSAIDDDGNGSMTVRELTTRHDVDNPDEIFRLTELGLSAGDVGHLNHTTRCLGDFPRKGGYKEIDFLKNATSEPVIADAEVVGPIPLDDTCRFLILATASVCKALEDAAATSNSAATIIDANRDLAGLVMKEFGAQPTINGVAQAVLDQISRRHYDAFVSAAACGTTNSSMNTSVERGFVRNKREDMMILIRNFNKSLATVDSSNASRLTTQTTADNTCTLENTSTNNSVWSTTEDSLPDVAQQTMTLPLDENGRIAPYVDFSEYYEAVKKIGPGEIG